MTKPIQGIFDFGKGNRNGIENFYRQQNERKERIRQEWSVPLGKTVRIRLNGFNEDIEGRLETAGHPTKINKKIPLPLRIDKIEFLSTDIEQCAVL